MSGKGGDEGLAKVFRDCRCFPCYGEDGVWVFRESEKQKRHQWRIGINKPKPQLSFEAVCEGMTQQPNCPHHPTGILTNCDLPYTDVKCVSKYHQHIRQHLLRTGEWYVIYHCCSNFLTCSLISANIVNGDVFVMQEPMLRGIRDDTICCLLFVIGTWIQWV